MQREKQVTLSNSVRPSSIDNTVALGRGTNVMVQGTTRT